MKLGFFFLFLSLFSAQAFACRDPLFETYTFFRELPARLHDKELVARVEILETHARLIKRVTRAKVLEAVHGTQVGDEFTIISDTSSCNHDPEIKRGDKFFVAGKIAKDGKFHGVWQGRDFMERKKK